MSDRTRDLDMDAVGKLIAGSQSSGLTAECIVWALYFMQQHPTASVSDACKYGLGEWVD